jgi:CarD family transcriptional regulator
LFEIGDKIVYPMHGAGIIEAVEEREVLGEKQEYYVLNMKLSNMQVYIPVGKEEKFGLRRVVDVKTMDEVLNQKWMDVSEIPADSNQRFRQNMEKVKSGNLYQIAQVVYDLTLRNRDKVLPTGEKALLDNAKQILISELVLVKGIEEEHAIRLINNLVS